MVTLKHTTVKVRHMDKRPDSRPRQYSLSGTVNFMNDSFEFEGAFGVDLDALMESIKRRIEDEQRVGATSLVLNVVIGKLIGEVR
jgi:hypothetical protein